MTIEIRYSDISDALILEEPCGNWRCQDGKVLDKGEWVNCGWCEGTQIAVTPFGDFILEFVKRRLGEVKKE